MNLWKKKSFLFFSFFVIFTIFLFFKTKNNFAGYN